MTEHVLLIALRLGVVAAGSLAALWSFRLGVHSRDQRGTYLLLALGFALLALGSLIEGFLFEIARWSLADAHTAEAILGTMAFALVLAAILRSRV